MVKDEASKGGRPSSYDPKYVTEIYRYLQENVDTLIEDGRRVVSLPTKEGFAAFIGVSKKTLYNWAEEHEEFLHALEEIEIEQHKRLINSGLSGDYNSTIAKLILSSNHGMREKTEQDLTSGGDRIECISLELVKPNESKSPDPSGV